MSQKSFAHIFPIVNQEVAKAVADIEAGGESISCGKGCSHCCHLLVEATLEEAEGMAEWVLAQEPEFRDSLRRRISESARERRKFFKRRKASRRYCGPSRKADDLPDEVYSDYFHSRNRPCPFLVDNACSAYEVRPVTCRLHLVTSPAELCARDIGNDDDFVVPDRIEQLRDDVAPMVDDASPSGKWGELAILVDEVLNRGA